MKSDVRQPKGFRFATKSLWEHAVCLLEVESRVRLLLKKLIFFILHMDTNFGLPPPVEKVRYLNLY